MELNIERLRKLCAKDNIRITLHAAQRLEQRDILLQDIMVCIQNGTIIEQYPDDYPYPSCLISLGLIPRRLRRDAAFMRTVCVFEHNAKRCNPLSVTK